METQHATPAEEAGKLPATPAPRDPSGLPVGDAQYQVAYYRQFMAQLNTGSRQYWSFFDQAMQDNQNNVHRMLLDPVISTCLEIRAAPTALLTGDVEPDDDDEPQELEASKRVTRDIKRVLGFAAMRRALLTNATFAGVSGAQLVYEWQVVKARLRMRPVDWQHVDGDTLSFDYSGWPSIRVQHGMVPPDRQSQLVATERGMAYRLSPEEREAVLVHRFNPQAAEFARPQDARTIIGSGLRGRLYWLWALKSQLWKMSLEWLKWFARGIMVWYFEDGNDAHRQQMKAAVEGQDGSHAMLIPRGRPRVGDAPEPYRPPFDFVSPSNANAQFLQSLITTYIDDMLRFEILHQSLTTQVGPSGLGAGTVAANHQTTFDNIVKMDALQLDDTLTRDLVRVLYRNNEPGITPGRWVSQLESPNVEQLMTSAQTIVGIGGSVPEKPLKDAAGIPVAKPGETILGGLQPSQPAAVTQIPDGTPVQQAAT